MTQISKTFCILPWVHVCSDAMGKVKPCCKWSPSAHSFNNTTLEDLTNNSYYKDIRNAMLAGKDPGVCYKCYDREKITGSSLRTKSNAIYGEDIKHCTSDKFHKLRYLELNLDNTCNLQCRMCTSYSSSALRQVENFINDNGIVIKNIWPPSSKNTLDVKKLTPAELQHLVIVKIIGGEPLYSKQHRSVLDHLIQNTDPKKITLFYSTNCTIFPDYLEEYWAKFNKIEITASLDGVGVVNDYQRYGSKFGVVTETIQRIQSLPNVTLTFHTVVTLLNVLDLPNIEKYVDNKGVFEVDTSSYISILHSPIDFRTWVISKLENKISSKLFSMLKMWLFDAKYQINTEWENVLKYIALTDEFHGTSLKTDIPELHQYLKEHYNFEQYYGITK